MPDEESNIACGTVVYATTLVHPMKTTPIKILIKPNA